MTTGAMVLGSVPLAIATGAGAEARNQIGLVIVGGMAIGTVFTLFVVPVMYLAVHAGWRGLVGLPGLLRRRRVAEA
jgi:multidrug efflux pump